MISRRFLVAAFVLVSALYLVQGFYYAGVLVPAQDGINYILVGAKAVTGEIGVYHDRVVGNRLPLPFYVLGLTQVKGPNLVVGCAFVLYMPFYHTIAPSQSVQLVIAIHAAPEGLSLEEIRQRYPATGVLAGRFETLVWAGYVTETSGQFALTAKGRLVSRPFRAVKWIWRLGPGG